MITILFDVILFTVKIQYIGPGKRNTGDWCFEDGFITFREIVDCYQRYIKGKFLGILCDCSYGGSWVRACMEYLDEQGVQPCAHSAKEKELFLSAAASCKRNEVPYRLLYSIRAVSNDKNTGTTGTWGDGWEITEDQHIKSVNVATIRCENKSIDGPCTLQPDFSWRRNVEGERVYLVRGKDKGHPAWHYVLLVDDEETIKKFHETVKQGRVDVADYGQVLESGWGEDPPNELKDRMERNYNITYT